MMRYKFVVALFLAVLTCLPGFARDADKIRLQVSSSNFPRFDRNLNTGGDVATGTRMRKAVQKVHHEQSRPSRLILPVAPEGSGQGRVVR